MVKINTALLTIPPGALNMNKQDLEVAITSVTNNMKAAHASGMHAESFKYLHQLMELEHLRARMILFESIPSAKIIDMTAWKLNRKKA